MLDLFERHPQTKSQNYFTLTFTKFILNFIHDYGNKRLFNVLNVITKKLEICYLTFCVEQEKTNGEKGRLNRGGNARWRLLGGRRHGGGNGTAAGRRNWVAASFGCLENLGFWSVLRFWEFGEFRRFRQFGEFSFLENLVGYE